MDAIQEKAREVGRLLAQTNEYKALKRANEQMGDDRETVTLLNQLSQLEQELTAAMRAGQEPTQEQEQNYQSLAEELQQKTAYQSLVAAQANFERVMTRINEEIGEGIKAGEQSRIILSS